MHGEEVPSVVELVDQTQLVLDQIAHLPGHAVRVALSRSPPGQLGQVPAGALARRAGLLRVLIAKLVEAERRPLGDLNRAGDRPGMLPKETSHLLGRFEETLGVRKES